jgi:hypothetical protein
MNANKILCVIAGLALFAGAALTGSATGIYNLSVLADVDGHGHPEEKNIIGGFVTVGVGEILFRSTGASLQTVGVLDYLQNSAVGSNPASAPILIYQPGLGSEQVLVWVQTYLGGGAPSQPLQRFDPIKMAKVYADAGLQPQSKIQQECGNLLSFDAGPHSMVVKGGGSLSVGKVLLELTLPEGSQAKLINISTRVFIMKPEGNMIAGFVLGKDELGDQPRWFMVRAVGPGLRKLGVPNALSDPVLTLHHSLDNPNGGPRGDEILATNNDWQKSPEKRSSSVNPAIRGVTSADQAKAGAFALEEGSLDAALMIELPPGVYSAVVTGSGAPNQEGLVEIYLMPEEKESPRPPPIPAK